MERIEKLAGEIAGKIGADVEMARRAARLAKADLTTGVVGEFPELQGVMGRYYAIHDEENDDVADAIRDHYEPAGPNNPVPKTLVSIAVALADKLDSLKQFFTAGEKPTGSGDPFALRRAALGALRIIVGNNIRFNLASVIDGMPDELFAFFVDRLKVNLREAGARYDLLDAALAGQADSNFRRVVEKVEALQAFLKTDDGKNLLAGYKRAANILKAEEKKDNRTYISEVDEALLPEAADKALHAALAKAIGAIGPKLDKEDFAGAMTEMAALRGPVDGFFEAVKVNADDPKLRENRLHMLAGLRAALHRVADFSRIEG